MKKEKIILVIIALFMLITDCNVYAHPGRTDANGCHTCRTNCGKWGLRYGQYHCHNGGSSNSSTNSSSSSSSNNNSTGTIHIVSSDTTLSLIKIDGVSIEIDNIMNYTTTNINPEIIVVTNSDRATVEITNDKNLVHGANQVIIKVTAENSNTRQYKLNINVVNDDATIKSIKVNNKDIEVSDNMTFVTSDDKVKLEISTNDPYAKLLSNKTYNLELGTNKITIDILAEDNKTKKQYVLNVTREKIISNNTDIIMYINNNKVTFDNYESKTIYLSPKIEELNIEYELVDKNAKINLDYDKKIQVGNKIIKFTVIAESGKEQQYTINIHKNSKLEEILYTIISVVVVGIVIFCTYLFIKKVKLVLKNNK